MMIFGFAAHVRGSTFRLTNIVTTYCVKSALSLA